jgi:hypothetical protein
VRQVRPARGRREPAHDAAGAAHLDADPARPGEPEGDAERAVAPPAERGALELVRRERRARGAPVEVAAQREAPVAPHERDAPLVQAPALVADREACEEQTVGQPPPAARAPSVPPERLGPPAEAGDEPLAEHGAPGGDLEDVDADRAVDAPGEREAQASALTGGRRRCGTTG